MKKRELLIAAAIVAATALPVFADGKDGKQATWCDLAKPGQSVIYIHDSRKFDVIVEQDLVPPGAAIKQCRWWVKKPADVPTELSISIGMFPKHQNARAAASEIKRAVFPGTKSRVVELYWNQKF